MTDNEPQTQERCAYESERQEDEEVRMSRTFGVMDGSECSDLKSPTAFPLFSLFAAQMCAHPGLWRTGLLLSFLCVCACLEEDCVVGIVGRPVSLPCFYPELLKYENLSMEWRRNDEVVLRSVWKGHEHDEMWGFTMATLPDDAAQTGNFSLELLEGDPKEDNMTFSLFIISEENQSTALCTVCLRIAASFSSPLVKREEEEQGDETAFLCQSSGGYPQPAVYWLINDTNEPPKGSVRTLATLLPDSLLYNITSHLRVNISKDASVSCIIENLSMNETLTSTSYGVNEVVGGRASDAMWIFSTGLCVVVGIMVIAGVAYQIHLDRISKRKKREYQESQRGYKRRPYKEDTEVTNPLSKETDV